MGFARSLSVSAKVALAGQYFHNRFTGLPSSITIEVTKRCNATCDFCPYWEVEEVDEVKDFSPAIRYFRPLHVSVTGGEPFLRKDLIDIIRQIKNVPGHRYIALFTNGWLLNEKNLAELIEAGVNQVQISCNYPDVRQDKERGLPGLYDKLKTFVPEMVRKGYDNLIIGTFLSADNLDSVVELAHVVNDWGCKHAYNTYARVKNDNTTHVPDVALIQNMRKTIEELITYKHKHRLSLNSDQYLRTIPEFFEKGHMPGCIAGDKFVYVNQEGYIKLCPELPPVAHISKLEEFKSQPVSCGLCWYSCRGEHHTKVTPQRVHELLTT